MARRTTKRPAERTSTRGKGAREPESFAALQKELHDVLDRGDAAAYDAGVLFGRIANASLYKPRYATLEAYADAEFDEGYSTLHRYRRVAEAFTRAVVIDHGDKKLAYGLTWLKAKKPRAAPKDLLRAEIEIAGKGRVAFDDVSVEQMEDASQLAVAARKAKDAGRAQRAAARTKAPSPKPTKATKATKTALERAVDVVGAELRRGRHAKGAVMPSVSLRTARVGRKDLEVVVIERLTAAYLARLGHALVRAAERLTDA